MKKKEMKYIQNGKEIKWLEKDPSPPSKVTRISKTYYRSCQYGELKLTVGDFILVSDLSAGDEDSLDGCEIAEIVHLYDTGDPDEEDPCWLTVQWFTRWRQLPAQARKSLPAGLPPPLISREVVLDARPYNPEVLVSTVWNKCEVHILQGSEDPALVAAPDPAAPAAFVTRFALQPKPLRLLPIVGGHGEGAATKGEVKAREPREAGSGVPKEAAGRTPSAGGRPGSTGKENDAPGTPSRQPTPDRGLSRSGRRRKEHSYRDLVGGKASWSDDNSVVVSYTSPNKMLLKLKRLSSDNIEEMLEDNDDLTTKKATPKRKARKSESSPPATGRSTPRSTKKTPRSSRETTPSRSAKRATPRPKTERPASVKREASHSRGGTPVSAKRDSSRAATPTSGGGRSSPVTGRGTPRSARRSLCRQPGLATVSEEQSPGVGSRSAGRPPARRLFEAEAGGAKRRRLCVVEDSEDEELVEKSATQRRGGRTTGRGRASSICYIKESSPEESSSSGEEYERTPVKRRGRGRAAASPATPSRGRGRGRGRGIQSRGVRSATASPRTPKVNRGTPLVPGRSAGCLDTPGTPLERARSRLHVAAVPDALPCRENEFFDIYTFVEARLLDGTGGCMYVSGVPGTGKTATMREVVRSLEEAVQTGDLPAFQFIEVNGMRLTEPQRVYCQILSELTGNKAVPDHAAEMLDRRFSQPAGRRQPVLLMVDELDLLWTRKQNVLYNLFDWPSRPHARLIVVAIANTMDLPERIMMNRVSSRLGLTRMTFQPYTFQQLQEIVTSRLRGLDAFDPDAVQLVSRKVAAVSGDARRALDICRRATELAERGPATTRRQSSPRKSRAAAPLVTMAHVNGSIQEMFSSPKIMAIRSCPLQARWLLQAVVAEFQRTGLEEARLRRVYEQMEAVCRFEGVTPPTLSETFALVAQLSAVRLLHAQHARNDLESRLRLNISVDDVSYAVQEMPDL